MDSMARTRRRWRAACGVCLALTVAAPTALAQGPASASDEPLRAELRAERRLYTTDGAIRLRFTLINTSDQVVVLPHTPAKQTSELGVVLPLSFALGLSSQPLLSVIYEDEVARTVPGLATLAPDEPEPPQEVSWLRLAPRGVVGVEIDLHDYYQASRYPGAYRVEWKPLGGRLGVATTAFRVESRRDAILVTDLGKVVFVLDYERAPQNVENFLSLAREGFYEGKTIHRVVPGFVIQGGCPKGDGTGVRPDGRLVPGEFRPEIPVDVGTLLMARRPSDPNSASCQFFIALSRLPDLDGQYTVVGQAVDEESWRTLRQLEAVPCDGRDRPVSPLTIRSINLVDAEQNRTRRLEVRRPLDAEAPPPVETPAGPAPGSP